MNVYSTNMYVTMFIQANIQENWQNACDIANHDVVWFLCAMQNYLKSPVSVIMNTSVYRDGQDGDPGMDRI
jgi:hypothetical protein